MPEDSPASPGPSVAVDSPAAQDRPTGPVVTGFTPPPAPGPDLIEGRHVLLERLDPDRHAEDLFAANQGQDWVWDYLGYGPFADLPAYRGWQAEMAAKSDPCFYALRDRATGKVGGLASFMRIDPANGVIEIGHIEIAPPMQRTPAATEAISLMIGWAFDAGYRRVEWKCDALNAPSRRTALRYGFAFEGIFRQHMIYKGRNRDTAWYAIIDRDWPRLAAAHRAWLAPGNFDAQGRQRQSLSALTVA
ncbi:GNAT family N-acetyltransferase [Paracoccus denitrificans]|uniref:GNAT family N-acetyltransferase n=1 Tax=Paracoccus denitrificans TaxID=266 RepID=UPI000CEBE657|nr:GNAT family protein [Paracoccus denitrificans]